MHVCLLLRVDIFPCIYLHFRFLLLWNNLFVSFVLCSYWGIYPPFFFFVLLNFQEFFIYIGNRWIVDQINILYTPFEFLNCVMGCFFFRFWFFVFSKHRSSPLLQNQTYTLSLFWSLLWYHPQKSLRLQFHPICFRWIMKPLKKLPLPPPTQSLGKTISGINVMHTLKEHTATLLLFSIFI